LAGVVELLFALLGRNVPGQSLGRVVGCFVNGVANIGRSSLQVGLDG
jgi:hypothetical protein